MTPSRGITLALLLGLSNLCKGQSFEILTDKSFLFPPHGSKGIYFAAGSDIQYNGQGEVIIGTLSQDAFLFPPHSSQGVYFAANTQIIFNALGEVRTGSLAKPAFLFPTGSTTGLHFRAGCQVTFDNRGEVESGVLDEDKFLFPWGSAKGVLFREGCMIQFRGKGEVYAGTLAGDTYLFNAGSSTGHLFKRLSHIRFNNQGDVAELYPRGCICSQDLFMLGIPANMEQINDIVSGRVTTYDKTVLNVLKRNNWNNNAAVIDVTSSMDPYVAQVYLWLKLNVTNNQTTYFTFFNDGDKKNNTEKVIGHTGGIYGTNLKRLEALLRIITIAKSNGDGGDIPENDIEAILYTIQKSPQCTSILHIADNNATPRDMNLLPLITKPVHVIVCGVKGLVNPALLNIARQTGGSLHTIEEDITGLDRVSIGDLIRVAGYDYRLTVGGFEHVP